MVQEKDAAKKRVAERKENLERIRRELDEKTIGWRWFIVEHTPRVDYDGGWDRGTPEKNVIVSDYFKTEKEATAWLDKHEPDKGNELKLCKQRLIEETIRRWV